MKYKKNIQNNTGFTLIETLVGLFIFVLAFTALSQVSGGSLQDISLTKRKLTAQYLAEEGVEFVKYLQKEQIANSATPMADFGTNVATGCSSAGDGCDFYFNPATGAVVKTVHPASTTPQLKYCEYGLIISGTATGLTCSIDSEYSRKISLDVLTGSGSNAYKVTSQVIYSQSTVAPVTVSTIIHFPF